MTWLCLRIIILMRHHDDYKQVNKNAKLTKNNSFYKKRIIFGFRGRIQASFAPHQLPKEISVCQLFYLFRQSSKQNCKSFHNRFQNSNICLTKNHQDHCERNQMIATSSNHIQSFVNFGEQILEDKVQDHFLVSSLNSHKGSNFLNLLTFCLQGQIRLFQQKLITFHDVRESKVGFYLKTVFNQPQRFIEIPKNHSVKDLYKNLLSATFPQKNKHIRTMKSRKPTKPYLWKFLGFVRGNMISLTQKFN